MDSGLTSVYVTAAVTIVMYFYVKYKLPVLFTPPSLRPLPGPTGWPVIGNVFQVRTKSVHETFRRWSQIHGPVYRVRFFLSNMVVISKNEAVQEILTARDAQLSGGIPAEVVGSILGKYRQQGNLGANAKLGMQKAYANARKDMEEVHAVGELTEAMKSQCGTSVDFHGTILQTVAASFCGLLSGRPVKTSYPVVPHTLKMESLLQELGAASHASLLHDSLPWFVRISADVAKIQTAHHDVRKFCDHIEQIKKFREFAEDKGLLARLCKLKEESELEKSPDMVFTEAEIRGEILNVVLTSIFTTASGLYSLLNILLHYPEVQSKMASEIEECVGCDDTVRLADKGRLSYVQAVVLETLRYVTVLPLAGPCVVDSSPPWNGTTLLLDLWTLHHNEAYWNEPWQFKPERFLDDDGLVLPPAEPVRKSLMPFGAHPAMCLTEAMVLDALFVFVANLVHRFQFLPPEGEPLVSCDPRTYSAGSFLMSQPYKLRAVSRHSDR